MLSLYAGGNGHPVDIVTYVVTPDGYRYKVDDRGMDPAGWIQYANQLGFLDPDGKTPLYHDAVAVNSGHPAQLTSIQAGVLFAKPEFPMFFEPAGAGDADRAGHPADPHRAAGQRAQLQGHRQDRRRLLQVGWHVLLHLDRQRRVPDRHQPRRGQLRPHQPAEPGAARQRRGRRAERSRGTARTTRARSCRSRAARTRTASSIHGGEYHLPFVDVENNIQGGPSITLINPPQGVCPPLNGGCSAAFYDDRGYTTTTGQTVGTPGTVLCGLQPAGGGVQRPGPRLRHHDQPARLRDRHRRQHQRALHGQLR